LLVITPPAAEDRGGVPHLGLVEVGDRLHVGGGVAEPV
jgi:hypothetical protein